MFSIGTQRTLARASSASAIQVRAWAAATMSGRASASLSAAARLIGRRTSSGSVGAVGRAGRSDSGEGRGGDADRGAGSGRGAGNVGEGVGKGADPGCAGSWAVHGEPRATKPSGRPRQAFPRGSPGLSSRGSLRPRPSGVNRGTPTPEGRRDVRIYRLIGSARSRGISGSVRVGQVCQILSFVDRATSSCSAHLVASSFLPQSL